MDTIRFDDWFEEVSESLMIDWIPSFIFTSFYPKFGGEPGDPDPRFTS